ncbi:MAG TPA: helix-turn-helix domain-containing protein, partial [Cyclobacteriaceae bacterium]
DFRLICATNLPLYDMIYEKKFRQDLLYRINTVEIRVPPLRERTDDIELLADHFLELYGKKYKRQGIKIDKAVISKMKKYPWPGNIRELQHAIERAVILSDEKIIRSADTLLNSTSTKESTPQEQLTMDEMEKRFILQSLDDHDGNVTQTANSLGMTRTALYRRMKKYKI